MICKFIYKGDFWALIIEKYIFVNINYYELILCSMGRWGPQVTSSVLPNIVFNGRVGGPPSIVFDGRVSVPPSVKFDERVGVLPNVIFDFRVGVTPNLKYYSNKYPARWQDG